MSMRRLAPISFVLLSSGCSFLNALDVCGDASSEFRVNGRADEDETPARPNAAVRLDDGRLLVAYTALSTVAMSAEARVVLMNPSSGARATPCNSQGPEEVISDNGYAATVSLCGIDNAVAAVGWVENGSETNAKVALIDSAGCPIDGGAFSPGFGLTGTNGLALAWSPQKKSLLAAYEDGRTVYASWHAAAGPAAVTQLDEAAIITANTVIAMAPNGRALIAWSASSVIESANHQSHVRAVLLDSDGSVLGAPLGASEAGPFTVDFPGGYLPNTAESPNAATQLAAAASDERFALALSAATTPSGRPAVFVRQFDGSGAPLGAAFAVDPQPEQDQTAPTVAYLPSGSLLVAWQSTARAGSVGRLFDAAASPRFNSISCDTSSFAVGNRAVHPVPGFPVIVPPAANGDLIVVHPGEPEWDSNGSGVLEWTLPFSKLWPAKP
jgi:hypothetical protein